MTRLSIPAALVGATLLTGLVFGLDPGLDLRVATFFYDGHGAFVGDTGLGGTVRRLLYWMPAATVILFVVLYGARRLGLGRWWSPTGRGLLFVLLTFAIGPGLISNSVLKDHSHRPRPYQTVEFGGDQPFRPFYTFDGACQRNCSFVSGEGATSAWTLGPALLVPSPWTGIAVAASLIFALCSGALRMAFGGHYLSDSLFAVLVSWIVLWLGWLAFRPPTPARQAENAARVRPSR